MPAWGQVQGSPWTPRHGSMSFTSWRTGARSLRMSALDAHPTSSPLSPGQALSSPVLLGVGALPWEAHIKRCVSFPNCLLFFGLVSGPSLGPSPSAWQGQCPVPDWQGCFTHGAAIDLSRMLWTHPGHRLAGKVSWDSTLGVRPIATAGSDKAYFRRAALSLGPPPLPRLRGVLAGGHGDTGSLGGGRGGPSCGEGSVCSFPALGDPGAPLALHGLTEMSGAVVVGRPPRE